MDEAPEVVSFKKHVISLRYWLLGRGYYNALKAMEYAMSFHKGTRKDKVTPEFDHQVMIAQAIRVCEPFMTKKEETFATIFLHDVMEDYGVGIEEIERRFGETVASSTWILTKKFRDFKKPPEKYYEDIGKDAIASVGKGYDRIHNFGGMVGVFTDGGQLHYVEETETLVLPMIKAARKLFPEQEPIYENIKMILLGQLKFVKLIHKERGIGKEAK